MGGSRAGRGLRTHACGVRLEHLGKILHTERMIDAIHGVNAASDQRERHT